jgi:hypothetical protein
MKTVDSSIQIRENAHFGFAERITKEGATLAGIPSGGIVTVLSMDS